jgi:hypothetical protein
MSACNSRWVHDKHTQAASSACRNTVALTIEQCFAAVRDTGSLSHHKLLQLPLQKSPLSSMLLSLCCQLLLRCIQPAGLQPQLALQQHELV